MRRDFHHLLNPSDDLPSGTASKSEQSPLFNDAYGFLDTPGASQIHFETAVTTETSKLQQNDSAPANDRQRLQALFEGLIDRGSQQGNGFDFREFATLLLSLKSSAFSEVLRNFQATNGHQALQDLFGNLHRIDPIFASQLRHLYENGHWPGSGGFPSQLNSRISNWVDQLQIERNPDHVTWEMYRLLSGLSRGFYESAGRRLDPWEIEEKIVMNFGQTALPYLRQASLRYPNDEALVRHLGRLIFALTHARVMNR
jgi:hypothetical protein